MGDELRSAVEGYSMKGYRVEVPILGPSTIVGQVATGYYPFVLVEPDTPMPFDEYVEAKERETAFSRKPQKMEFWQQHKAFLVLPGYLQDRLEEGGKVSQVDQLEWSMKKSGCLRDGMVVCDSFVLGDIEIPEPQAGMLLEFEDHPLDPDTKRRHQGETGWAGRVIGSRYVQWVDVEEKDDRKGNVTRTQIPREGTVTFIEQFVPVPFMEAPEAIVPAALEPGFQSQIAPVFGYGLGHAWKKAGLELPPGKWVDEDGEKPKTEEDDYQYVLDEPMPLSEIHAFCREYYPDAPLCADQAMFLFVVPIFRVVVGAGNE